MPQSHFPKDFASLDEIFSFVGAALGDLKVSRDVSFAVELSIEELFTNMVKYGRGAGVDVMISIRRESRRLVVELIDTTDAPFDPAQVPQAETSLPLEDRKVGGLGIHLVRTLMDELHSSHANGLNSITLIKNLET